MHRCQHAENQGLPLPAKTSRESHGAGYRTTVGETGGFGIDLIASDNRKKRASTLCPTIIKQGAYRCGQRVSRALRAAGLGQSAAPDERVQAAEMPVQ